MNGKIELSEIQKKILFVGFVYSFCRVKFPHMTIGEICKTVNRCVDDLENQGRQRGDLVAPPLVENFSIFFKKVLLFIKSVSIF